MFRKWASLTLLFSSLLISSFSAYAGNDGQDNSATRFYENAQAPVLIPLIRSAKKSIQIEIYQIDDLEVRAALRAAIKRGVRIQVVKEPTPVGNACRVFEPESSANPSTPDCVDQKKLASEIRRSGGTYVPFNKALCGPVNVNCLEHGKLAIFDSVIALISTGNFDASNLCTRQGSNSACNRDYSITTTNANYVAALSELWSLDAKGVPYDTNAVLAKFHIFNLTVSPNSLKPLKQFIASAKKSIQIQNQYVKDPDLIDAIKKAALKGVEVELMTESFCYFSIPSQNEIAFITQIYTDLERAGVKTREFTSQIRVGGKPGYLHAKAIVVDGKWAWVGSVNGSSQSLNMNREFGIIFSEYAGVSQLSKIMAQDFANPGSESWQESIACKKDH